MESTSNPGFSFRILGLDWNEVLPRPLRASSGNFSLELSDYATVADFVQGLPAQAKGEEEDTPFVQTGNSATARTRYYQEVADLLTFKDLETDKVVGVFVGALLDWSTYYIRYVAVLPEYRNRSIMTAAISEIADILSKYPVERFAAQVSPTNTPSIQVYNKLGFRVSSLEISERWGAVLLFTRFLSDRHNATFVKQFCASGLYPSLVHPRERRLS